MTLSVGEHVRLPRTYRGRDVLWWMDASGVWDERYDEVDDLSRARRLPSPQLVGTPERTTLDLNALTAMGVELVGRWAGVRDGRALFSGGLRNVFSLADLKLERLLDRLRRVGSGERWRFRGRRPRALRTDRGAPVGEAGARSRERRDPHDRLGNRFPARLPLARRPGRRREGPPPPRRRRRRQPGPLCPGPARCCGGANPRSSAGSKTTRVTWSISSAATWGDPAALRSSHRRSRAGGRRGPVCERVRDRANDILLLGGDPRRRPIFSAARPPRPRRFA